MPVERETGRLIVLDLYLCEDCECVLGPDMRSVHDRTFHSKAA